MAVDVTTITADQFKQRFPRDFIYGNSSPASVADSDINNSFIDAQSVFNVGLFNGDTIATNAYLLLTAHWLCLSLRASNAGVNGVGAFPVQSRSVGSVSESYAIPAKYLASPSLAMYTQTTYGLQYLAIVLPSLVGNTQAVCAVTNP